MKKLLPCAGFILIVLLWATAAHADPPGPPGPGGTPGGSGGVPVGSPVDGGLSLLLALGFGYGGYKLVGKPVNNETERQDIQ